MKSGFALAAFTTVSLAILPLQAEELVDPSLEKAGFYGGNRSLVAVEAPDLEFTKALRLEITKQPQNQWDAQASFPTKIAVEKGDIITISLWMRGSAIDSEEGAGLIELDFEKNTSPHTKSLQFPAFLSKEWKKIECKCRSVEAYAAGAAHVTIKLGFLAQWVEVAAVEVINHGTEADFSSFPSAPVTYEGRELAAPWRIAADARIEEHRKADLKIIVVDKHGQRVPNTKVRAVLQRHEFAFGTAIAVDTLLDKSERGDRYRSGLTQYFNSATIENGLKWKAWEGTWPGVLTTQEALLRLGEMGLTTRGHVMVWPGWRHMPEQVESLAGEPEKLQQRILDHIALIAGATRGHVTDWDVMNELYDNTDVGAILGDETAIRWFEEARKFLPETDLYYNDYAGLVSAGLDTGHKRHFEKTIKMLIDGGAPLDGIGIQGHFGLLLTPPRKLYEELDRWSKFDRKIKITEFDLATKDEKIQADYTRDFLTTMFSHPQVEGVSLWGFWAGRHWKPDAALLRDDWTERPAGKEWRELVSETWHTDTEVMTDENGEAIIRGFRGHYEIRTNGPVRHASLGKNGGIVTVGQW